MDHGDDKKRVEASGETFPAHDQSTVLPLKPGKRPLDLEARDRLFDRPPPRLAALPYPFGNLGPDTACAKAMTEVFGIIALICGQDLGPFARAAPLAGTDVEPSSSGRTWARSSPFAGVVRVDSGIPAASVRL